MKEGDLGKLYQDGEVILRQGEAGDRMYVVQAGQVEVLQEQEGKEIRLTLLGGRGDLWRDGAL